MSAFYYANSFIATLACAALFLVVRVCVCEFFINFGLHFYVKTTVCAAILLEYVPIWF